MSPALRAIAFSLAAARDGTLRLLRVYLDRRDRARKVVVALFDSPVRGARCARAMTEAAVALGIEIRAGVHTGEVERAGESVRGVAVHLAARVMALGGPSEVLVSGTTAELLAGSGLELESIGPHELKGVPGAREIFRLRA